jgi:flap endonuclease-1
MGVQISEILPKKQIDLEYLKGKTIAVDSFNWLYQFLSSIRQPDGTLLMDSKGRTTSHLSGLFYRNAKLIESGIRTIYVFDGKPSELKRKEQEKRREAKKEARKKWEKALEQGDEAEAKKQAMRTAELTHEMVDESKELLAAMGIPIVQAESEGEAQCAMMAIQKEAFAAASSDFDSLLFGSPRMVKNLNITGKRKIRGKETTIYPELIELQETLSALGINHDQLIILGILTGTDYNNGGVRGIGPKKALKLIAEHRTFEKIFENVQWEFDVEPMEIFELFKKPKYIKTAIEFRNPDCEGIKKILCDNHDFSQERIDSVLKKIACITEQKSLSSFFGKR